MHPNIQKSAPKDQYLCDFMIMHDFTFLWNKNSIFSQEYDAVFKELRGI